ncbi:hypothetical protein CU098_000154, partial [Rhizopus stolonifer]
MTLMAPSLITPSTSKLLSYLSFNKPYTQPSSSKSPDMPTFITIVMRKDGTLTTKCLNDTQQQQPQARSSTLLTRRRRSFLSLQCPSSSPPKQRRLIPSFIPRFQACKRNSIDIQLCGDNDQIVVTAERSQTFIQRLPIELMVKTMLYLDCLSLLRLSETCKHLHRICHRNHHYLWQTLFRTNYCQKRLLTDDDYYDLYKNHYRLNQRWKRGNVHTRYLTGHEDSVYCLVWFGSNQIVSGSRDRSVKVWDLSRPQESLLLTKTHHDGSVLCLRISSDMTFMVSGSSDTTCLIWSLPEFVPRKRLIGHSGGVLDVCILESLIVSSSRDASIRVWDTATGQEIRRLEGHAGPVNALGSFKRLVVSASGDTTLRLWDVDTGHCLRTFIGHTRGLACVRFDGKFIYSGGQDNKLKVWDASSGNCISTLTGHSDLIRTIDSFENIVVSGSYDKTLRVWDMKENK